MKTHGLPIPVSATHEKAYIAITYSDGKTICRFDIGAALEDLRDAGLEFHGYRTRPIKNNSTATQPAKLA